MQNRHARLVIAVKMSDDVSFDVDNEISRRRLSSDGSLNKIILKECVEKRNRTNLLMDLSGDVTLASRRCRNCKLHF